MLLIQSIHEIRYQLIGLVGRVFTNGLGDLGPVPGQVIPKTLKMVLDTSLLNTQHYEGCIKGKVVAIEKGAFRLPTLLNNINTPLILVPGHV